MLYSAATLYSEKNDSQNSHNKRLRPDSLDNSCVNNRPRSSKETVKCFSCLFRYLTAINSSAVYGASVLLSENQNRPRSHHQATEGFSWKLDQLRVSDRWPAFYDGRNSNVGLRTLTLGAD